MYLMADKYLIVGATGVVGSYIYRLSKQLGLEVKGTSLAGLTSGIAVVNLDKPSALKYSVLIERPTHIILCAALTDVDRCEKEPYNTFSINTRAAVETAALCFTKSIHFTFISSDYVFDGYFSGPFKLETKPNPSSVYGRSKADAERWIQIVNPNACIVRTTWVFGLEHYRENPKNFIARKLKYYSEHGYVELSELDFKITSTPTYSGYLANCILDLTKNNAKGIFHCASTCTTTKYRWLYSVFNSVKTNFNVMAKNNIEPLSFQYKTYNSEKVVHRISKSGLVDVLNPLPLEKHIEMFISELESR
jgi:dTDP-4-dehydrorhamnose reductase